MSSKRTANVSRLFNYWKGEKLCIILYKIMGKKNNSTLEGIETSTGHTEIRPTYPANKARTDDAKYALATMSGSLSPHSSKW